MRALRLICINNSCVYKYNNGIKLQGTRNICVLLKVIRNNYDFYLSLINVGVSCLLPL